MKEELLHYVWKHKLVPVKHLQTVSGEAIQVVHAGRYNTDGGPDFLEAKVRIGDTLLAGSVEIHVRTSDWKAHGHDGDRKYANVILHVVYFHDDPDDRLPVLELNGKIPPILLQQYGRLMDTRQDLPCRPFWPDVERITVKTFIERLVVERLERRATDIHQLMDQHGQDWLQVIYRMLGHYFGGTVNAFGWESLTERLDYRILLKHADNTFQLEALLFGTAGFLAETPDEYALRLQQEFHHLKHKYGLREQPGHYWNFLRIRPDAFPTLRLAFFAQLIHRMPQFSQLADMQLAVEALSSLRVPEYWRTHYRFGKPSDKRSRRLGKATVQSLLLNVCVPLQYAYARNIRQHDRMQACVEHLYSLPPEANHIAQAYAELLGEEKHACATQAVLELNSRYCRERRCLYCRIGHRVLQGNIRLRDRFAEPDPDDPGFV